MKRQWHKHDEPLVSSLYQNLRCTHLCFCQLQATRFNKSSIPLLVMTDPLIIHPEDKLLQEACKVINDYGELPYSMDGFMIFVLFYRKSFMTITSQND